MKYFCKVGKCAVSLILAVLFISAFIVPASASDDKNNQLFEYYDSFMEEISYIKGFERRMKTLAEKDDPTAIEVEICAQYVDIYVKLLNLNCTEMGAPNGEYDGPYYESLDDLTEEVLLLYSNGEIDGAEAVDKLVTAAFRRAKECSLKLGE